MTIFNTSSKTWSFLTPSVFTNCISKDGIVHRHSRKNEKKNNYFQRKSFFKNKYWKMCAIGKSRDCVEIVWVNRDNIIPCGKTTNNTRIKYLFQFETLWRIKRQLRCDRFFSLGIILWSFFWCCRNHCLSLQSRLWVFL